MLLQKSILLKKYINLPQYLISMCYNILYYGPNLNLEKIITIENVEIQLHFQILSIKTVPIFKK